MIMTVSHHRVLNHALATKINELLQEGGGDGNVLVEEEEDGDDGQQQIVQAQQCLCYCNKRLKPET